MPRELRNYKVTNNPEIFRTTYWGNLRYNNKEIIENRNKFIEEWEITKCLSSDECPKYVLYQSEIYPFEKNRILGYIMSWDREDFGDHSELYKTKKGYAIVVSPTCEYDEEAERKGYVRIPALYHNGAYTYIKTNFIANKKSVKQYYKEQEIRKEMKKKMHKIGVIMIRVVPMMMLWRKRATERVYHPSRMKFEI
jgi:hypothetical protein